MATLPSNPVTPPHLMDELTEMKGGSWRLRGYDARRLAGQAIAEIERLRRELAEAKRHRDNAIAKFNAEYEAGKGLLAHCDRLRAALAQIRDWSGIGHKTLQQIAREALAGQSSPAETEKHDV